MPHVPNDQITHPSPRNPLVFDIRTLGHQPGTARSETRIVPAPADLRVAMACVPPGADIKLTVMLEAVSEGVLVTAEATAPVTGECARCLEPAASSIEVAFRELYEQDEGPPELADDASDRRFLQGELLDLEPAFRDAAVLALPLAPLCRPDCAGLCVECGVRLADAGRDHDHARPLDPRWARLGQLDLGTEGQGGARAVNGQEG